MFTSKQSRSTAGRGAVVAGTLIALSVGLSACSSPESGSSSAPASGESSGDGAASSASEPVVITCASCADSPTDPFLSYNHQVMLDFNEKYKGKYEVQEVANPLGSSGDERLQYLTRLAQAGELPDLVTVNPAEIAELQTTGSLMDFKASLDADPDWAASFFPGAFDAVDGANGEVWAVPQTRDVIGIYYNKAILADAGISEFPKTWDELGADCQKIADSGKTCLAMDGNWTTLLTWADLIGTQDGGAEFLTTGISGDSYANVPQVVKATETLRDWYERGYFNSDSFTGDYQNAATPFVHGDAAFIANGPWMVPADIKADTAKAGLYDELGYEPSPGWTADGRGAIVVAGQGSLISGAQSPEKQEAVTEFMKYYTSPDVMFGQTLATGSYFPVDVTLTDEQINQLEPLALGLVTQAKDATYSYPHAYFDSPAGFGAAWGNLWPAYAKGELSTDEFLTQLGQDAAASPGN